MLLLVLALTAGKVEGVVTVGRSPLPGCSVTLGSTVVTGKDGRYQFDHVPPGKHELMIVLEEFETVMTTIDVHGDTTVPPIELRRSPTDAPIIGCGLPVFCRDEVPETRTSLPLCADLEVDSSVAEAIRGRDPAAIALARKRFESAFTYRQKHYLARMLLGTAGDDSVMWNELHEHATNAVRYVRSTRGLTPEYLKWAAERGLDPSDYYSVASRALSYISEDPRSRTLLHQAIATDDYDLISTAIFGFASQKDLSALPVIEAALRRLPRRAHELASSLAEYKSREADALALKYLSGSRRESYLRCRAETRP
jgi:hypothetical protein